MLLLLVVLQPLLASGCASITNPDKRILQYLNKQGFGRRYSGNAEEQNYVSIGDSVRFADLYNPDLQGLATVDIDGTIQIDLLGSLWVAGYTRGELEAYLNEKLAPYYTEVDVKVTIASKASKIYYVLGEVVMPGPRPFLGNTTLFDAVVTAAPTPYKSNVGRVRLIRADPRDPLVITADISKMWESGDSTYNPLIQENDIIFVPPTLLQEGADFLSGIIVPFTSVFQSIFGLIFQLTLANRFNRVGGGLGGGIGF
ncbi:MAG: polysaccharide biosynthesis/export family protein [Planctomycetota bacterium]